MCYNENKSATSKQSWKRNMENILTFCGIDSSIDASIDLKVINRNLKLKSKELWNNGLFNEKKLDLNLELNYEFTELLKINFIKMNI